MEIEFKTKNDKQIEAVKYWIDPSVEQILYGGAKGGGKSYLGASVIFGDALIYPGTHYFIARQEGIDLRKFTIPTINEVFKNWGLDINKYAKYNGQDSFYSLHNDSKVFLIACKPLPSDPLYERFGSMQMTRGWIEEGGEVVERAKANLWLSIGRWKNKEYHLKKKLLITANPKKGWMKREFVDPARDRKLTPDKKYIQAFATDNVYLPQDYLKTLSEEKDQVTRQRLWQGNWEYDEDQNSLISYDALTDVFTNSVDGDNKFLVMDIARLGKDSTTFGIFKGLKLIKLILKSKQGTDKTIEQAKEIASQEQIPYSRIIADEDGIGGAIVDGMRGIKGFVANSSPLPTRMQIRIRQGKIESDLVPKTNFKNLKSQCGWKLAELINEHKLAVECSDFINVDGGSENLRDLIEEELNAILRRKDVDKEGRLQLIPKDEVKQIIGRSPDIGDLFLMRVWFELREDALDEDPVMQEKVIKLQQNQFNIRKSNFNNETNK